ncbi:MAG: alkaline phosphatase family protein, partial [Myxococcales bacterium]|nr:alkaline phosphatase family protein [Myxococcales bacterium]
MSGMPAEEGGAPPPQAPEWRDGVVGLADRSVDPDAASRVVGAALIALAGLAPLGLFLLYGTLDAEPIALEMLRAQADPDEPAATVADRAPPEPAILVILDGLRLDEAERLPSLERLRHQAAHGALRMPAPTRSRPMYHALFTGVPPAGSGVRSNRFAAPARLDTLTDRVRAAGGSVAFFAEGKDWLARMLGTPGDAAHADEDALGGRLDRSLEAREPATLRMLHLLAIDASAHDGGLRSPAHRRALRRADRFVDALLERWPGVLAIVSDHGHAEGGGHGGDEAEVSRVPWLLRA